MRHIDINCDMAEGIGNDAALMPYISSANICCGYHAGDAEVMEETIGLAITHGVSIGAHVSFPDKENFGRSEMHLEPHEIYRIVQEQLHLLKAMTETHAVKIRHVKPHGALYNMSARDRRTADAIAAAVAEFDRSIVLMGLSGSVSIVAANAAGLQTANEVFADRRYEENGALRSRSLPGALLEDAGEALQQVLQMVSSGTVTALSGKKVPVLADSICIHGDGLHAVEFAQKIYQTLKNHSIDIKAI